MSDLQDTFSVLGLMSGTSLDGLDICHCSFTQTPNGWEYEILHAVTYPYTVAWANKLKNAIHLNECELEKLDLAYGKLLAEFVNRFLSEQQIHVNFIASHGHTIFHQPENGYTLQIGNGKILANKTKCTIINDFRSQDVKMGGQGAPLVPIGDQLLFKNYNACINLGGFANISFEENGKRIAFDICPINIVLNKLSQEIGLPFDKGGTLARSGKINNDLLEKLNSLPYYQQAAPKSLGVEWLNKTFLPLLNSTLSTEDLLRTVTEHTAMQIANAIPTHCKNVLITGGGAFNSFFIKRLQNHTEAKIIVPNKELVEFKEALVFAFLGVLRIHNQTNVLSSVTGASKDHCSGVIIEPN